MKSKRVDFLFSFSLIAIGVTTVVLADASLFSIDLPDALRRALGIVDLCALPILIYAVVRKWKNAR